jgi:zinc/manganese transport system substrate-binding protein
VSPSEVCYTNFILKEAFMKKMILMSLLIWVVNMAWAEPIPIIAAENFYGHVAQDLGGPYVQVTSILNNPQQDPHLFSANPQTAKAIAGAAYIIFNGLDYDAWILPLITTAQNPHTHLINVAELNGKKAGNNPHIWYNPQIMAVYAEYLTEQLSATDKAHQTYFANQFHLFLQNYQNLMDKIHILKNKYQGTPVIATEPIFNEMAQLIGLQMQGMDFQLSIMNNTEPSISAVKNFEYLLTHHQVRVLIFNKQVMNPAIERIRQLAYQNGIPTIGVSETEPPDQNYFSWMNNQLDELSAAIGRGK